MSPQGFSSWAVAFQAPADASHHPLWQPSKESLAKLPGLPDTPASHQSLTTQKQNHHEASFVHHSWTVHFALKSHMKERECSCAEMSATFPKPCNKSLRFSFENVVSCPIRFLSISLSRTAPLMPTVMPWPYTGLNDTAASPRTQRPAGRSIYTEQSHEERVRHSIFQPRSCQTGQQGTHHNGKSLTSSYRRLTFSVRE